MGLFTDEHGDLSIKNTATTSLGAIFALTALLGSPYVVQDREVAMEVSFGKVEEVINSGGLFFKTPLTDSVVSYPLWRQHVPITAEEANLRTGDQMKVTGEIFVDYEIDSKSESVQKLYSELRGDIEDINELVKIRAKGSAVSAFGQFKSIDLATKTDEIDAKAKTLLQGRIDSEKWPIKILTVISNGVRLSPESEKKLEAVMEQQQKMTVLDLRKENAEKEKTVYKAEGQAFAELYNAMIAAGVPANEAPTILCLKMANDHGKIQEAFAPGCFPGQNGYQVAVDASSVKKQAPAPAPAQ